MCKPFNSIISVSNVLGEKQFLWSLTTAICFFLLLLWWSNNKNRRVFVFLLVQNIVYSNTNFNYHVNNKFENSEFVKIIFVILKPLTPHASANRDNSTQHVFNEHQLLWPLMHEVSTWINLIYFHFIFPRDNPYD